ncbi:obscurin-like protein [Tasmannia lanceolata]|uniref:obscurin-like protein n=1 Tax=Tasmannia lanceolata TaxID=3420 RepID=UPI004062B767
MAAPTQTPLFLEEWLRNSTIPSPSPSPASARDIVRAWAELRDCLQNQTFQTLHLQSLYTLRNSQTSVHVADPQAKLLLSILSTPNLAPPQSYSFLFRLLYIWTRKSSKPSSSLLQSSLPLLSNLLSTHLHSHDNSSLSEAILLLGSLSAVPILSQSSRKVCFQLLHKLLEEKHRPITEELVPEVLAGIGYSLIRSEGIDFDRIFTSLLNIWSNEHGPCACVLHGLMLLHLMEWLVLGFIHSQSFEKIEFVCRGVSKPHQRNDIQFAVVMAAAGILRAFNRVRVEINPLLRNTAESSVVLIAIDLISKMGSVSKLGGDFSDHLLLQCISLGLARSGQISFHAPVLLCILFALLIEIFPLQSFCGRAIENPYRNSGLTEVKKHVDSIIFKEAGAVTSAFCSLYVVADEENKLVVENYIWSFCQEIYSKQRLIALVFQGEQNEMRLELDKIAEAAFLMIVFFASAVAKNKVNSKCSRETRSDISVRTLVAFSCIEHLRHIRLPEYSDTIRRVISTIQEDQSAGVCFVESIPSYFDLTNQQGLGEMKYIWSEDEVQTARVLFYLRVIPTCIIHIPHHVFSKIVAPTMFLYMRHPSGKVARASHSLFAAFISSAKDTNEDDGILLKEQLVFYYMQRALEAYPGITPFEGMASGVAALVRHLPAGSPSIFYCIHSLVEKATSLCSEARTQDANIWKNWQGGSEPCQKILDLLLRLISLVDIQVLPDLLKQLAQLILQLPKDGQNMVLDEMYSQVAESDDVTRKPILVSWLQSLSFLSSQAIAVGVNNIQTSSSAPERRKPEQNDGSIYSTNALSLNRTSARL